MSVNSKKNQTKEPHVEYGDSFVCILFQLFRSRPLSDGTRGVSNKFRDQHVFSPKVRTDLERQTMQQKT
jgi:hypothetical protein